ncbi:MAG: hypothetical protein JJ899_05835 [Alphaproteobacteria bacterium]|nr:hypothetical protein [Alphaproteobacteria bacterium]
MNQMTKAAQTDFRSTETNWSAPATTVEYDKDGNPATVVSPFREDTRAAPVASPAPRPAMFIARSDEIHYDDGDPGTVLA